ncbi:MAG: hypothetical protein A2131_00715 [Candidatus Sungbacteria bacterium GWC2_49_10]|uniref:Uncharacterized protein n=2 Tax=Parcubacteria group TaxID=1794811 RepID=A0A0G1WPG6_9BACT|nr:MAG: hypothetical protein UY61_C0025G0016 [Candidatus Adlerbacteria bacterium GW2011_GWC1_50_9]OGZ93338.1 MAG: hypothetical protein A2131_00715 [Candidatus Sungbacteria bacterium GWC2_49_10]
MNEESPQYKSEIESARLDLAEYIEQENRGEAGGARHFSFPEFTLGDLEDEDVIVWKKIRSQTITPEEFALYDQGLHDEGGEERKDVKFSRIIFVRAVRNKVQRVFYEYFKRRKQQ